MKRWPVIRHMRWLYRSRQIDLWYGTWLDHGYFDINRDRDDANLDAIWRGEIMTVNLISAVGKELTLGEFASLLAVGNTCAVLDPPAVIPAEHSARLVALGYMADLDGRLRMTTPGRIRIAAGR
jgi:hypothetical protein